VTEARAQIAEASARCVRHLFSPLLRTSGFLSSVSRRVPTAVGAPAGTDRAEAGALAAKLAKTETRRVDAVGSLTFALPD